MGLAKHLLKRKKQFKKAMDELDRLGKKLPGVMRESDRKREAGPTYEDLYGKPKKKKPLGAVIGRKKKKKR